MFVRVPIVVLLETDPPLFVPLRDPVSWNTLRENVTRDDDFDDFILVVIRW